MGDGNVKEKVYFEREFTAYDEENYTARYMVKVWTNPKREPALYFMNCRKTNSAPIKAHCSENPAWLL